MFRKNSLAEKMLERIKRSKSSAFLPTDFFDMSDRDQIGRVLRRLVKSGVLLRLGQGVYAKAKKSEVSGRIIPAKGLANAAKEALKKLGVRIYPGSYERNYNQGVSSQVPNGLVFGVKKRVSRRIAFNGKSITYEHLAP